MDLCPLVFTGQSNGVYYYYCYLCTTTPPSQVGGQDTRAHLCGVDCSNIKDPLAALRTPPKFVTTSFPVLVNGVVEPVYLGKDARTTGLPAYIGFQDATGKDPSPFINAA